MSAFQRALAPIAGACPNPLNFVEADVQQIPGLQVRGAAPESVPTLNRTDQLLEPGDLNGQPPGDVVK